MPAKSETATDLARNMLRAALDDPAWDEGDRHYIFAAFNQHDNLVRVAECAREMESNVSALEPFLGQLPSTTKLCLVELRAALAALEVSK